MVGNLHHHAHVMLDQQHGGAFRANELQKLVEFGRFTRVEARRGLVEAQEMRVGAHGPRDLQATLCPIGQVAGRIVGPIDQVDLFEPVDRLVDRLVLRGAVAGQAQNAADAEARRHHKRIVLRNEQVLQHRHAAE